jgi:hypothetical protein
VDSLRTKAIRALAPHCEHRLFLSATPHNGYLESFTALLELLDDQRFARGVRPAADFVTTLLRRRLFSSPKAFADTLEVHLQTMTSRERHPAATASERVLRPLAERLDETAEDDATYDQAEQDALTAVRHCSPALSPAEGAILAELGTWAQGAQDRPDAKFTALRNWLDPIVPPTGDSAERVIIFTEYRATQRWLYERLLAAGYPAPRLALLYGGQDEPDREHVKNAFTADPELDDVRVLIATDAASEGINLQWHCHRVLHWEIPWNPNRLEQRNGRVDRHGQRAPEVQVRHFVPAGWQAATASFTTGSLEDELDFLRIAVEKVDRIREDLGSAGEVISAQVARKMLGRQAEWISADTEIERRPSEPP